MALMRVNGNMFQQYVGGMILIENNLHLYRVQGEITAIEKMGGFFGPQRLRISTIVTGLSHKAGQPQGYLTPDLQDYKSQTPESGNVQLVHKSNRAGYERFTFYLPGGEKPEPLWMEDPLMRLFPFGMQQS